jgi:hypothetical protein
MTTTRVINLFAGPGAGKTTIAAGLFHEFKKKQISCEYVSEYAKDVVWENTPSLLENQIHIFSEQFRRQWRLMDKVKYIITDSPLLLNSIYFKYYLDKNPTFFSRKYIDLLTTTFDDSFFQFDNVSFFVDRPSDYDKNGRLETENQSMLIDKSIKEKLAYLDVPYYNIGYNFDTVHLSEVILRGIYENL